MPRCAHHNHGAAKDLFRCNREQAPNIAPVRLNAGTGDARGHRGDVLAWRKAGGRKTFALEPEAAERPSPGDKNTAIKAWSSPKGVSQRPGRFTRLSFAGWVHSTAGTVLLQEALSQAATTLQPFTSSEGFSLQGSAPHTAARGRKTSPGRRKPFPPQPLSCRASQKEPQTCHLKTSTTVVA